MTHAARSLAAGLVLLLFAGLQSAVPATATSSSTAGSERVAAAAIPRPPKDPFYSYDERRLAGVRPGTPLRTREVSLEALDLTLPYRAVQVLYRTTDSLGEPTYSVTTVAQPLTGTLLPRLVSYQSFYDALSPKCNPSYTLRGGNPGAANTRTAQVEAGLVATMLTAGYVVNVPDFQNIDLHWVAGPESGRSTLDSIRAALRVLELPRRRTPVGLLGYSGGSIGSEWAAELAPRRAPELDIVGVASGGMPVHLAHNLRYVDGSPVWSSVAPGALVGISRAYDIRLRRYLTPLGREIVDTVRRQCIGEFSGAWPGLRIRQVVKRRYRPVFRVPIFRRTVNRLIMGSAPGHPTVPLFFGAGIHDGIGDGVMIADDQEALAHQYCEQGVAVQYEEFEGMDHTQAGLAFLISAQAWIATRFLGTPPSDNCASIGEGNSLAPLR